MAEFDDEDALSRRNELFDDCFMYDCTIGVTFPSPTYYTRAHKAILSLASPYFQRLFKRDSIISKNTPVILEEKHAHRAVNEMLRHIYGLSIEEPVDITASIELSVVLLDVASRYEVQSLFRLAETRLSTSLRNLEIEELAGQIDTIYSIFGRGEHHQIVANVIRESLAEHIVNEESLALFEMYPELAATVFQQEMKQEPQTAMGRLQQAVEQTPPLALDLLKALTGPLVKEESSKRKRISED